MKRFFYSLPELSYPDTLNACHAILDAHLESGRGSAPAIYFNDSVLSYQDFYVVATSPLIKAREIAAVIESATPRLLITEADLWENIVKLGGWRPPVLPRGERVEGLDSIDPLLDGVVPIRQCVPTHRDTLAIIVYTSGKYGCPERMHSHASLLATTDTYARAWEYARQSFRISVRLSRPEELFRALVGP